MKVLFVDHSAELGGAELSLIQLVTGVQYFTSVVLFEEGPFLQHLAKAGVSVEVMRGVGRPIPVRRESGWLAAMRSVPAVLVLSWALARRARGYDVIFANSQKAFAVSAMAGLLARRPVVWHLHDILTAAHFGRFLRGFVVRLANLRARWVIVNSLATAAAFESLGGNAARLSVVYQGIQEAPFSAVFLYALAQVPGTIGVIVGEALFGEDAYAQALKLQVAALGIESRVRFLGFRTDVPALMSAMDVIVHSSVAPEPFGRVVVEGMMAGRPVVSAAAGGVLEIIEDGVTGFLYEPGNAEALADTISRVLAAPDEAAQVARAGQTHARQNFSEVASVNHIAEILSKFA